MVLYDEGRHFRLRNLVRVARNAPPVQVRADCEMVPFISRIGRARTNAATGWNGIQTRTTSGAKGTMIVANIEYLLPAACHPRLSVSASEVTPTGTRGTRVDGHDGYLIFKFVQATSRTNNVFVGSNLR